MDIQETEKRLNFLETEKEYVKRMMEREEEGMKNLDPYLVKELTYICLLLEKNQLQLSRIEDAQINHEVVLVETDNGIRMVDFMTGKSKRVNILTESEFHEYINRREGFKIF